MPITVLTELHPEAIASNFSFSCFILLHAWITVDLHWDLRSCSDDTDMQAGKIGYTWTETKISKALFASVGQTENVAREGNCSVNGERGQWCDRVRLTHPISGWRDGSAVKSTRCSS